MWPPPDTPPPPPPNLWLCGRTAEQGLVASVGGGQRAQTLQPLAQNSAQVAGVAKAADGDAVQVHGLHEVAQQRALQAQDVPSAETRVRGVEQGRDAKQRDEIHSY